MAMTYLLAFTRLTLGIVFTLSFFTKVGNVQQFTITITKFKILPANLSKWIALLFLGCEGAVIFLLLFGDVYLIFGFAFAFTLLLLFSVALISVLVRRIPTSCNCFGSTAKPVSIYDVGRNISFVLCALLGLYFAILLDGNALTLTGSGLILVTAQAIILVLFMTYLDEFALLFQQS